MESDIAFHEPTLPQVAVVVQFSDAKRVKGGPVVVVVQRERMSRNVWLVSKVNVPVVNRRVNATDWVGPPLATVATALVHEVG